MVVLSGVAKADFQYYFLEALCQQEKGNYTGAFDLLEECRKMNPESAEVYYLLSRYYYNMKQQAKGQQLMEKAAQLAPTNDYYQEVIADYYISNKEYGKAIEAYQRVYNNNHNRGDVLEKLIRLGAMNKDLDISVWALEKLEILEGKSERLSMMKYQILLEQKKDREALDELQELANTYSNDLNYQVLLGDYYAQHNMNNEALNIYDSVLIQEPENISAQMSLYRFYLSQNAKDDSYRVMKEMLTNKSVKSETKMQLIQWAIGENEKEKNDSTEILKLFDSVLSVPQEEATLKIIYAFYLESIKYPQDSIERVLKDVLEIEPDNETALQKLVFMYWERKEYDKVIAQCQPARQYHPEELVFYYCEGLAYYNKKEHDAAIDLFQRGLSTINDHSSPEIVSDFYLMLGDLYHQKGQRRLAFAAYDSCLQWKPDHIGCLNNYAYYLSLEHKELDKAEKMSYKTIKKEPENETYLDTYAWILFEQERFTEAKIYIDKALKNMIDTMAANDSLQANVESDITILQHAGDIYAKNNEIEKAVDFWAQAQKLAPENKLLMKKIRKRKYYAK